MLIWLTIGVIWVVDRLLKVWILGNFTLGESMAVIPGFFHLTYILNPGAAFGMLPGKSWIFILTALVAFIGIIYAQFTIPRSQWSMRLTLGLIGGGALGNLYDRLFIGKVVDYLDFQIWPFVFNFADSAIVVGAGLLIVNVFLEEHKEKKRNQNKLESSSNPESSNLENDDVIKTDN